MSSKSNLNVEMEMNPILKSEPELQRLRNRLSDSNRRVHAVNSILDTAALETLKYFEYWLHSIADDDDILENEQTRTVAGSTFTEKMVGTMSFILHRGSSSNFWKTGCGNVRAVQFIVNWTQSWNNIMITDDDYFGEENNLFKLLCEFYFHGYVMAFVSAITLYMIALYIVAIVLDASDANVYIGPALAELCLLGAYVWGGHIYKGNLNFDSLDMGNSRFAREKIQLVRRNYGDQIGDAGLIVLGSKVLVKSYQDGDWVRAVVTKIHTDGNAGRETGWSSSGGIKNKANTMTFDVQYESDANTTETRVAPKYIRIRDKNYETPMALVLTTLRGLSKIYFDSIWWLVCCGKAGNIHAGVNINGRRQSADSYRTESRHSQSGRTGPVTGDMQSDFRICKDEILEHYRFTPMKCGYWEMLDWSMKYLHVCGDSKKQFIQFSYHGVATALLKLTIFFIPGIIALSNIWAFFDRLHYKGDRTEFWDPSCAPNAYCQGNFILFWFSLGYFMSWLTQMMLAQAVVVIFVGLLYGCDSVYRMLSVWQNRFQGLRRIGDIPTAEELDEAVGTCNSEISTATLQRKVVKQERKDVERMMLLAPLIRRDAYERYLIMHHFISELSSVWSSFLFFTLLLSLVSTGLSYYLMVHTSDGFVGLYLFAIAIETAMFVWPVWCVVRANSHVGIIKNIFNMCSADDYILLGDKDEWIRLCDNVPLYWTIAGIPITKEVLIAYYSAAFSAAPIVLTVMLNLEKDIPVK